MEGTRRAQPDTPRPGAHVIDPSPLTVDDLAHEGSARSGLGSIVPDRCDSFRDLPSSALDIEPRKVAPTTSAGT